jgi:hypothetical protein
MAPPAASANTGFTIRPVISPAVTPDEVKKIRTEQAGRTKSWTLAELERKSKEELVLQGTSSTERP